MSLNGLLEEKARQERQKSGEIEITRERVEKDLPSFRELIAYWRMYPDRMIDYYCSLDPDCHFHFYAYQRLFLRCALRYKNVYATFVRAWSKSFMSDMALMCKAILYPGAKLFTVSGVKAQSAQILQSKISEICALIPPIANEIIWDTRGKQGVETHQTKDDVRYTFRNGSIIENIAAAESSRGRRYQSGLMEECVGIDQDMLNEVVIPTMNVSRMVNGKIDPKEKLNKSQIFITTAGYKGTFSYDKLIEFVCRAVAHPKDTIILGGSWRTPVVEGLLDKDFVTDLKLDGTYNEASFEREYESLWSGDIELAFFSSERMKDARVIKHFEDKRLSKADAKFVKNGFYYVFGVDVGRFDCATEVAIIKVTQVAGPQGKGYYNKQVINIYSFNEENFIQQSLNIKKLYWKFLPKAIVLDSNGLGSGLLDIIVSDQINPRDQDQIYPGLGVINDTKDDDGHWRYKPVYTENTIKDIVWSMKANPALNSEMYAYCQQELTNRHLKFLISEAEAKNNLLATDKGKRMTAVKRADYLRPFTQTSILIEQMANLIEDDQQQNIVLKQASKKIKKDKFSALIYGLYWIKHYEERMGKRKTIDVKELMFFN